MNRGRPIAAVPHQDAVLVVCDDGSVWRLNQEDTGLQAWQAVRPIPGSDAEYEADPRNERRKRKAPVTPWPPPGAAGISFVEACWGTR